MIARLFSLTLTGAVLSSPFPPHAAQADPWQSLTPEAAGFRPDVADSLDSAFAEGRLEGLHAVVVTRHGKLVFERYYQGQDQRWGTSLGEVKFDAATKHDLRSVSKSIVGLLYGIALAEGLAPPLDAPIVESFPEYPDLLADPQRRRMTVAHALTMKLGLQWNESLPYDDPNNSEIAMEFAPDRYRFVLSRPFLMDPGKMWQYNGGATALLGKLIADGSGQPLFDFAKDRLFTPLGITDVEWVRGMDGEAAAASGLRMRPRDVAKVGQILLDGGQWKGKSIVPGDWLEASFTPRARAFGDIEYGYQWWLGASPNSGMRWIAGFGNGGQRLVVIPDLAIAIVITAGNYNQRDDWQLPVKVIADHIMPALQDP